MRDPLQGLKKAMDNTVFCDFSFSKEQRKAIENKTAKQRSSSDYRQLQQSLGVFMLQKLSSRSGKTGVELLAELETAAKAGDISGTEGDLYVILHRMEQKQLIRSQWVKDSGQQKRLYFLEKKGATLLYKWERADNSEVKASLTFQIEGGLR